MSEQRSMSTTERGSPGNAGEKHVPSAKSSVRKRGSPPGRRKPAGSRKTGNALKGKMHQIRDTLQGILQERMGTVQLRKLLISGTPYLIIFYLVEKEAWLYRHCTGDSMVQKLMNLFLYFTLAFRNPFPSFHLWDMMVGIAGALGILLIVRYRRRNAKKYRQGEEYGSARWGAYYQL